MTSHRALGHVHFGAQYRVLKSRGRLTNYALAGVGVLCFVLILVLAGHLGNAVRTHTVATRVPSRMDDHRRDAHDMVMQGASPYAVAESLAELELREERQPRYTYQHRQETDAGIQQANRPIRAAMRALLVLSGLFLLGALFLAAIRQTRAGRRIERVIQTELGHVEPIRLNQRGLFGVSFRVVGHNVETGHQGRYVVYAHSVKGAIANCRANGVEPELVTIRAVLSNYHKSIRPAN